MVTIQGGSPDGIIASAEHLINTDLGRRRENALENAERARKMVADLSPMIGKAFPGEAKVQRLSQQVEDLRNELAGEPSARRLSLTAQTDQGLAAENLRDRGEALLDELRGEFGDDAAVREEVADWLAGHDDEHPEHAEWVEAQRILAAGDAAAERRGEKYQRAAANGKPPRYSRFARPGLARWGDFRSAADRQKIAERVKELVRQMAPDIDVEPVDGLVDGIAAGKYFRGLITASLSAGDIETIIRHEVIHALKEMGVISGAEWATLVKAATDSGMLARVQAMAGYAGEPLAVQQEEAVAQLFGEWRRAPGKPLPAVRRVLARIRDFLARLANALRGMGFHTPESIFERIERGDVGRRYESDFPTSGEARYARGPVNMERAEVQPHADFFAKLGVMARTIRANYPAIFRKRERKPGEAFASVDALRQHVETALSAPDYVLPGNQRNNVLVVKRNGRDQAVAVRLEAIGRETDYWVRSAYMMDEGQLDGVFNAIRARGATPERLAFSRLPVAGQASLAATFTTASVSDRLIKIARGEVSGQSPSGSDPKYSLFNLRRAAAPMMAQPAQDAGTDAQREIIRQHIGTTEVPFRQRIRDAIAEYRDRRSAAFKQAVFDRFHAARELGREAGGRMAPWQALQLTKSIDSVMAVVLRRGPLEVYNDAKLGKWFRQAQGWQDGGFDQLFKPLADAGTLELWKGWAMAVRADRLLREGREHRLSRAEVDALLPLGRQHPEFQQVLDRWQAFNQRVLEMARDAGLLTQQQVDLFSQHGDYVPFYRLLEDEDGDLEVKGPRGSRHGVEGQRSPAWRLKGGQQAINDPVENMVMNLTAFIDRSFKNLAMQKVTRLALDSGAMAPVKWKWWGATEVTPEQAARALEDIGVQVAGLTPAQHAEMLTFFHMQKPTDPDVISVMVGGKPKYYRVTDPLLLQAVTAMAPVQLSGVLSMFRTAKEALTTGVTVTPAFMVRNSIRDTVAAWVMYGINPLNSVKGALKALNEDNPHRLAIMAAGGGGRGFYATDPADVRKFIDRHLDTMGHGKMLNPADPRDWWEKWQKVGAASEQMNRIARYQQVLASGGSQAEAAFEALDMLDFGMHGASPVVQTLIAMLPFFNARLQGLYKLGRRYHENRKGVLTKGLIIAGLTLALLATNWDDDDYERLEDWDKDSNWHFKIDGEWYRIPKPFELGVLFATLPERLVRWIDGRDDNHRAVQAMLRNASDQLAFNPVPQIGRPVLENWANKVAYTGRPIEPIGMETLPAQLRYRPSTSETARAASQGLGAAGIDLSPLSIEQLTRGYFGGLGMAFLQASDLLVRALGDYPEAATSRASDWPVVGDVLRSFWSEQPPRNTRYTTDFYAFRQQVEEAVRGIKALQSQGLLDDAKEMADSHRPELALRHLVEGTAAALTKLNQRERLAGYSTTMTAEQKRAELDRIIEMRNELTRRVMLRVPAVTRALQGLSADGGERSSLLQWAQP